MDGRHLQSNWNCQVSPDMMLWIKVKTLILVSSDRTIIDWESVCCFLQTFNKERFLVYSLEVLLPRFFSFPPWPGIGSVLVVTQTLLPLRIMGAFVLLRILNATYIFVAFSRSCHLTAYKFYLRALQAFTFAFMNRFYTLIWMVELIDSSLKNDQEKWEPQRQCLNTYVNMIFQCLHLNNIIHCFKMTLEFTWNKHLNTSDHFLGWEDTDKDLMLTAHIMLA